MNILIQLGTQAFLVTVKLDTEGFDENVWVEAGVSTMNPTPGLCSIDQLLAVRAYIEDNQPLCYAWQYHLHASPRSEIVDMDDERYIVDSYYEEGTPASLDTPGERAGWVVTKLFSITYDQHVDDEEVIAAMEDHLDMTS